MKKSFLFLIAASFFMLFSCSNDDATPADDNEDEEIGVLVKERPDWTATAPDWLDPTACQIVVVTQEELPFSVTADDMLAAFINDECRTVAFPHTESNGKVAFILTILPKIEANEVSTDVMLRYYSAQNKRIYTAAPFPFIPGETLGDLVNNGYPIDFVKK